MLRDKDIREPLFDFLEEMCGKIRILEEKQIGKSRADIVMVLPELAHIQEPVSYTHLSGILPSFSSPWLIRYTSLLYSCLRNSHPTRASIPVAMR